MSDNGSPQDNEAEDTKGRTQEDAARKLIKKINKGPSAEAATNDQMEPFAREVEIEARRLASGVNVAPDTSVEHSSGKGERTRFEVGVTDNMGVQVGDSNLQINVHNYGNSTRDLARAKEVFHKSLQQRDSFVGSFLQQALKQAETTFRLSLIFMAAGGIVVLAAGVLALSTSLGPSGNGIALVSALGGVLVGTCGAAFSLRADRARKHLADQAETMHSQLQVERTYVQVAELLGGIKDEDLNDRARVALAMKLMGANATTFTEQAQETKNDNSSDSQPAADAE